MALAEKSRLIPPEGEKRVLLHSCCAPCSGHIAERLSEAGIILTIFFYNPNIHPRHEYDKRKEENIRFAQKKGMAFVDADYDTESWFARVRGLEREPERGERCRRCFDLRFERTALYAFEHGFKVFTSSLGISRWKDWQQVTVSGRRAAARYPDLIYWDYNWRKQGGTQGMYAVTQRENFYRQQYCGCIFSWQASRQRHWARRKEQREPMARHPKSHSYDDNERSDKRAGREEKCLKG